MPGGSTSTVRNSHSAIPPKTAARPPCTNLRLVACHPATANRITATSRNSATTADRLRSFRPSAKAHNPTPRPSPPGRAARLQPVGEAEHPGAERRPAGPPVAEDQRGQTDVATAVGLVLPVD